MNKLHMAKRVQIVKALVEGSSLRSTSRMVGVSINTVTKLLVDLGTACETFHDSTVRNVPAKRVQADEIWSFCYARKENVPDEYKGVLGFGDLWTWVGQDADSKLVLSWHVGRRDAQTAYPFMHDLASRISTRVQLTTDGLHAYLEATDAAFGTEIDYARLIKVYGSDPNAERRYAPPVCINQKVQIVSGDPAHEHISTSYIERQNLQMRMSMRRFTRLTNGHSKKVENHLHALALHYVHYNFSRVQRALGGTPAMVAGLAQRPWSVEGIVGLLDVVDKKAA
ncbi:MAG: IS1 family transposase [Acidobacteria bacterium]|nr:IS1 family transposase [Acidobacteriota bacterium]